MSLIANIKEIMHKLGVFLRFWVKASQNGASCLFGVKKSFLKGVSNNW